MFPWKAYKLGGKKLMNNHPTVQPSKTSSAYLIRDV